MTQHGQLGLGGGADMEPRGDAAQLHAAQLLPPLLPPLSGTIIRGTPKTPNLSW
jgi:hypothetical protein